MKDQLKNWAKSFAQKEGRQPTLEEYEREKAKLATLQDESKRGDEQHFCPNCGTPVSATARFCPVCGHKLNADGHAASTNQDASAESRLAQDFMQGKKPAKLQAQQPAPKPHKPRRWWVIGGVIVVLLLLVFFLIDQHHPKQAASAPRTAQSAKPSTKPKRTKALTAATATPQQTAAALIWYEAKFGNDTTTWAPLRNDGQLTVTAAVDSPYAMTNESGGSTQYLISQRSNMMRPIAVYSLSDSSISAATLSSQSSAPLNNISLKRESVFAAIKTPKMQQQVSDLAKRITVTSPQTQLSSGLLASIDAQYSIEQKTLMVVKYLAAAKSQLKITSNDNWGTVLAKGTEGHFLASDMNQGPHADGYMVYPGDDIQSLQVSSGACFADDSGQVSIYQSSQMNGPADTLMSSKNLLIKLPVNQLYTDSGITAAQLNSASAQVQHVTHNSSNK